MYSRTGRVIALPQGLVLAVVLELALAKCLSFCVKVLYGMDSALTGMLSYWQAGLDISYLFLYTEKISIHFALE